MRFEPVQALVVSLFLPATVIAQPRPFTIEGLYRVKNVAGLPSRPTRRR